jgi:hypothetical protein
LRRPAPAVCVYPPTGRTHGSVSISFAGWLSCRADRRQRWRANAWRFLPGRSLTPTGAGVPQDLVRRVFRAISAAQTASRRRLEAPAAAARSARLRARVLQPAAPWRAGLQRPWPGRSPAPLPRPLRRPAAAHCRWVRPGLTGPVAHASRPSDPGQPAREGAQPALGRAGASAGEALRAELFGGRSVTEGSSGVGSACQRRPCWWSGLSLRRQPDVLAAA